MFQAIENSEKTAYSEDNFIYFSLLKTELDETKKELEKSKEQIRWFEEQFKLYKQRQFGKKAEQLKALNAVQLDLFDILEEATSVEEQVAEKETITYTRNKKSCGRKLNTANLPREVELHDIADKHCECCGNELEKIGEDRSEQIEYIPEQLKVIEHIRPKYTCRHCATIKSAQKPEAPLAKSMAGASLIAEIILKKYHYHLPLYRQSKIFHQQGLDLPDNTLGNWVMQAGGLLEELNEALWQQIPVSKVLQADETPVNVLTENKQGYMWCYHGYTKDNRFVIFEYSNSRSGTVASNRLKDYQGILQTDGYSGYNELRGKENIINIGCFAHCRRKFAEIVKISKQTGKAHVAISYIKQLYKIESESQNIAAEARKKVRQEQAKPILDKFKEWLEKSLPQSPPQSAIGKAISYALNQWKYLYEYVNHGDVPIDNNLVENQIRPFALGRKNWLFAGNEKGANVAALFYSLIQTCLMNNINPRNYLIYVLKQVHKLRRNEINPASLLPQFIDKNLLI